MIDERLCAEAVERWGHMLQYVMLYEEVGELLQAVSKYLRYAGDENLLVPTRDNVLEEVADVEIMLAQLRLIIGGEDHYQVLLERKQQRLRERLHPELVRYGKEE